MDDWIGLIAVLGMIGLAVTIVWPVDQPRDPYAAPFGEMPPLPDGSIDRSGM